MYTGYNKAGTGSPNPSRSQASGSEGLMAGKMTG